jgi:integrase
LASGAPPPPAALDGLRAYAPERHGHTLAVDQLAASRDPPPPTCLACRRGRARNLARALVLEIAARAAGAATLRVSEHGVRHGYLRQRLEMEGVGVDLRALWS